MSKVELRRTLWRLKLVGSACVRVHCTVALSFTFTELCCTDSKTPADASETKEGVNLRRLLSTVVCKHFQRRKLTEVLYARTWSEEGKREVKEHPGVFNRLNLMYYKEGRKERSGTAILKWNSGYLRKKTNISRHIHSFQVTDNMSRLERSMGRPEEGLTHVKLP